jgi:hypothetical protein
MEAIMSGQGSISVGEPRRGWAFVSYAHADKGRVLPIVGDLESRGILVWWDDLLLPGDAFAAMIRSKLADAACVVVVWSRHSVRSDFVLAEATTGMALQTAEGMGRLLPVVLDEEAKANIPLPFTILHHCDLTAWDGQQSSLLDGLATAVQRLVDRPTRSEETYQPTLRDEHTIRDATAASAEMRNLTDRIQTIGLILADDHRVMANIRAALHEVHKTVDVVSGSVEEFVRAGVADGGLDPGPYVRFERGMLKTRIRDARGHCDLIGLHYARPDGIRPWLVANAPEQLDDADNAFKRLMSADGDLFRWLGRIGDVLTNESRVVVNLLVANQGDAARKRVSDGRERLKPLEDDLQLSIETLQRVEQALGFTRS